MIHVQTKWVGVAAFTIDPADIASIAHQAALIMQRNAPLVQGFIEGIVMVDDTRTRMVLVSQWESRESWAAAEWNELLSQALGDWVESSKAFDYHGYEPITVVRAS